MGRKMPGLGEADYRSGALERLEEAFLLLRRERFGGAIYLAGRAVEGMLRAVIWKSDSDYAAGKKSLETGHDLRDMLRLVRNLGVLRESPVRDAIASDVQAVGRLWSNSMRFMPTAKVRTVWRAVGEVARTRTLKQAAAEYYAACSSVIKRCEALWQSKRI
jgi:hypothetical protein